MNNGIPPFSRNLNLLTTNDLSTFFHELARSGYSLPVTSEDELEKLIQFGKGFFPESTFEITAGMTPINELLVAMIRRREAQAFLENTLPIIMFLYAFKDDNDFIHKIKTRLTNPTQFGDTLFELKCLKHFHKNGFSFKYEPKVFDEGKERNPDFRLTKNDIKLFCECKQVRVGQNKAELKFDKDRAYVEGELPKNLQQRLFNAKLRLEINFKRSPSLADLDELGRQINLFSSGGQGIRKLPLQQIVNSIEYLVIPQSEPSPFQMIGRARTITFPVKIGNPFKIGGPINNPGGEISFISTDLVRRTAESLAKLINGAKKQLPDNKLGIIVINRAKATIAKQAIERRINSKGYGNIISFIVNPFDNCCTCYRTRYGKLLFNLFEGFQSENPFGERGEANKNQTLK